MAKRLSVQFNRTTEFCSTKNLLLVAKKRSAIAGFIRARFVILSYRFHFLGGAHVLPISSRQYDAIHYLFEIALSRSPDSSIVSKVLIAWIEPDLGGSLDIRALFYLSADSKRAVLVLMSMVMKSGRTAVGFDVHNQVVAILVRDCWKRLSPEQRQDPEFQEMRRLFGHRTQRRRRHITSKRAAKWSPTTSRNHRTCR